MLESIYYRRLGSVTRWAAIAIALCTVCGCGDGRPARVPVSGQVLIDGKPLAHGFVRFVPKGARPSGGDLDEDGHFTLTAYDGGDGAVLGNHRVEIAGSERISPTQIRWHAPRSTPTSIRRASKGKLTDRPIPCASS